MKGSRSRGAWAAGLAAVAVSLPFLGRAYHMDEPFFLAVARHWLADPSHPLDFLFNWYGESVPMGELNNTPPLIYGLLAAAWKATGGAEIPMRLSFLPLDAAAAVALHAIAARFLRRPLLPVLAVLASPAYMLTMGHLCPEKAAMALGLWGVYAAVRGADEDSPRWLGLSAAFLAGASLTKYHAAFLVLPAAGYALDRGRAPSRVLALAAAALAPVALYVGANALAGGEQISAAWKVTAEGASSWWSGTAHKGRSFLAFTGGALGAVALWLPWVAGRRAVILAGAAFPALLFLPALDPASASPLWIDRALGMALAAAGGGALAWVFSGSARFLPGWALWAPWILGAALVQWGLYWAVLGRVVAFLVPPLILALAAGLEAGPAESRARLLRKAGVGATLALTLLLAYVDHRYAALQREFAREVARPFLRRGVKVWYTGHWGFQFYLEEEGARPLEHSRGGWAQARRGEVVVWSRVNANVLAPRGRRLADVRVLRAESAVPLRLMSGWSGQAGFYSSNFGFLPFALSREPLDEFSIIELL